ncbi:D-alanyl-D-alanine carboxypeptidase [Galbibacter marinus]|uniref:D-alanyl-D-alanine carboxypeptidase n=1 Tax=Galbibacter marinus TaxID=555500 RepID=K2QIN3_9FLAO|nr:M15 family metallopeptidase [Galbibacter marinus]EKF54582.1 D-alanyl-D-alanine carboxypeptidase [Galbibacter marinus]
MNCIAQDNYSIEVLTGKTSLALYGDGIGLQKQAYDAFLKMKADAKKQGIEIQVASGHRDFSRQKSIWNRKYKAYTDQGMSPIQAMDKIIEYSTYPGTSRHHWGTDIDIIDAAATYSGNVLVPEKYQGDGPFCKLKEWMDENSQKYGFYLVYTDNPDRKGFYYEPWHYSYKPISKPMLDAYRKLDIAHIIKSEDLLGRKHMTTDFINSYIQENVLGINPDLR